MSILLVDSNCPKCKTRNWVNYGDPDDITGYDIEAVHCYDCGHYYWIEDSNSYHQEDTKPEDYAETGFPTPYEAI